MLGVPHTSGPGGTTNFGDGQVAVFEERNYVISGVAKDASNNALGNCTVRLFNTATNVNEQTTTADASGNYSFVVDKTQAWYLVAYLSGSPDVAGTTPNTLVGS